jgi:hypothetical protein
VDLNESKIYNNENVYIYVCVAHIFPCIYCRFSYDILGGFLIKYRHRRPFNVEDLIMTWKFHGVLGITDSGVTCDIYENEKAEAMLRVDSSIVKIEVCYSNVEELMSDFKNKAAELSLSLEDYINTWYLQLFSSFENYVLNRQ